LKWEDFNAGSVLG